MRFAIYHPWVYLRGGIERVLSEVIARSRHDWTIYTHHYEAEATFPTINGSVVELSPRVSVRRSIGPLARAAASIATTRLPEDGYDGLLVSSESLGELILARSHLPAVCYCLTPLKILHDPHTAEALAARDPAKAKALALIGPPFTHVQRRLFRRYRHVFVVSQETARRLAAAGLAAPGTTEVLYPGVDTDRFAPGDGARDGFFLVAGRIMWEKGIELAIDALAAARAEGLRGRLVVAGAVDEKSQECLRGLRSQAAALPVDFEVDPTDERMAELYRCCTAVVFTPRNEDFGIVPLEAMASGAPVIALDRGGPRETVVHGRTGWLVEPDAGSIADRMLALEALDGTDQLVEMRRAARERAMEFSWTTFVERLDDVMEAVARSSSRPASR